ncbi:MAG: hypothetical protein D6781_04400 [Verrucomicrobia bacterium]|nr:MAG: hypothetical protein D6781_04400 [Verrucomicrobiota bacterium]
MEQLLFELSEISGYGELRGREVKFVEAIVAGRTQREAAQAAGVRASTTGALDVAASKLAASPRVRRVLRIAWERAAQGLEKDLLQLQEVIDRAAEEMRRAGSAKARAAAFNEFEKAVKLKAAIHGRLTVNFRGEVEHRHVVLSQELRQQLIEARRALISSRIAERMEGQARN